jgi:hypothetical protein
MAYEKILDDDIADLLASENVFLQYPLSSRLFAHIHGGILIKDTKYEGMNLGEGIDFIILALEQ